MKINPDIFRAYDIRGVYPEEINKETAYLIGRAYIKFLRKKNLKIVVGRDGRISSPTVFENFVRGILDQGARVIDIGLATTPMLYFSVAHFKFNGGTNITASHQPSQYNGFKLVREKAIPISEKSGLKKIKEIILKGKFNHPLRGKIIRKETVREYINFNLENFNFKPKKNIKIVIDTANAVPGILNPYLKRELPFQIYFLFEKLNGNFPNHSPNPLIRENLVFLQEEVKNKKADLGIAFDGDGDRIIFVDEKGKVIPGDLITALLSKLILEENAGVKILYDIRSSRVVPETIKENKGRALAWKVGHSLIKEKMRKEDIFFAGEFSGHYYKKDHYFSEVPLFVLFKIIQKISESDKSISELIKPYRKYFHSGEINFEIKNKEKILKKIEKRFKKGKTLKLDGLRVDFKDWWFLVRPSGTEDILRLIVEAKNKELLEKKKREIITLIR